VSAEVELWMLEGSEFQTVGAAMLKPREAKVVQTRWNRQKIGVGRTQRTCGSDIIKDYRANKAHANASEARHSVAGDRRRGH